MNEAVTFRVYLARETLRRGVAQASSKLSVDRMGAILDLDQATEMLLGLVVPMVGGAVGEKDMVGTLWTKLTEKRSEFRPQEQALGRLHRLRNRVQHDGVVPSTEDARTMAVETEAAFRAIGEQVIGREVFERGAVSLVTDAEVRGFLEDAETKLTSEDAREALVGAAAAFQLAKGSLIAVLFPERREIWEGVVREVSKHIGGAVGEAIRNAPRQPVSSELSDFVRGFQRGMGSTMGKMLNDPLVALYEPMAFADAGIDFDELRQFREVVPTILFTGDGGHQAIFHWPCDLEDARFAVGFATRSVLRLEAAVSRLGAAEGGSETKRGQGRGGARGRRVGPPGGPQPPEGEGGGGK